MKKDPRLLLSAAEDVLDTMIDEIILGVSRKDRRLFTICFFLLIFPSILKCFSFERFWLIVTWEGGGGIYLPLGQDDHKMRKLKAGPFLFVEWGESA